MWFLKRFCVVLVGLLLFCSLFSLGFCDDFTAAFVPLGFEVNGFDRNKNWASENGIFVFGFLERGGDEYAVGIRYNLGSEDANMAVWTVGGGLRVPLNSTFRLAMDGRLVLVNNPNGIVVWSSNTSALGVQKASLLNNGNLVLLGAKDEVLWESFSSPTNTLLPGQSLHYPQNLRAPSTKSISSYYNLVTRQSGQLALVWEHNVTYWESQFVSSAVIKEARFNGSGVLGLHDNHDNVVWSVSSKDFGDPSVNLRQLRIDQDGNLRIYSFDAVSLTWRAGWQAVEDQCNVFGSCGLYSVCGYNSTGPVCECLYSDPSVSGMGGTSVTDLGGSGCKKMVDLDNCRMHTSILVVKQTVLYGLYPPHDVDLYLSAQACKEYCSNDTTCIAATSVNDGSGRCTIKRTPFISGYKTPSVSAVSFMKVCNVPQAVAARGANPVAESVSFSSTRSTAGKGSTVKFIGAVSLVALLTITIILSLQIVAFLFIYQMRKVKAQTRMPFGKDAQMNPRYSALIRLSFEEIKELTDNFAIQLGPSVFKGLLPNKTPLVAKVLNDMVISEKDFRVTVSTLGGTHHRNLVCVKGFCFEQRNKVLLYEFVPKGSVDKWLFDPKQGQNERTWQQRLDIALGVARALAYLHSECQQCITHGNLKLENVLLDENLVPKVTDFGLRTLLLKQVATSSSESPSERDIYMLGKMFLQIVTNKREGFGDNIEQILHRVNEENKLSDSEDFRTMERVVRIALWCMKSQPFLRPSIGEVVKVLEGTLSVDRPPSGLALRCDSMNDRDIATEIEVDC